MRHMEFAEVWGSRIKARCDELGITLPELAQRLSVDRSTAYRWATGTEPTNDMKIRIAQELGLPARELFSLEEVDA